MPFAQTWRDTLLLYIPAGLVAGGALGLAFGPGLAPVAADFFTYVTCGASAQAVIRLVAGPAGADPLARTKRPTRAA